jgi:type I restriction enzyme M protein
MNDRSTIISTFWNVADVLRDSLLSFHEIAELPASLFFLKRLTDSAAEKEKQPWLSRCSGMRKELAQFAWADLSNHDKPSEKLLWLLRKTEKAMPALSGLSEHSNLAYLTRSKDSHEAHLRDIGNLLNTLSLDSLSCDEASEIFQQLLDGMADRAAGSSVTPVSVRELLVGVSEPGAASSIYDPVCGYASLLCDAARVAGKDSAPPRLYGQDLHLRVALIAKMHTLLGNWDSDIRIGDTLEHPQHVDGEQLQRFDVILANPPFGVRVQPHQIACDRFGRFEAAQPTSFEVALIQHIAKSLSDRGRAAVLVPNGFLFRSGSDYKVRRELIETGRIHAIIGLPSHLFPTTAIAASVLILNGPKRRDSERGIVFIDLTTFAEGQKTRRHLSRKGIETAVHCLHEPFDQEGIVAVVPKEQISKEHYDLAVSRYIRSRTVPHRSFADELPLFLSAIDERNRAEQEALSLLNSMNAYNKKGAHD